MPSDEALKAASEILDVMSRPSTGAYAFGHADKQLAEIIDRHMKRPMRVICTAHHTGGGAYYTDECESCRADLAALLVEAAEMIDAADPTRDLDIDGALVARLRSEAKRVLAEIAAKLGRDDAK